MTTLKTQLNDYTDKDGRRTLIIQIIHERRRGVIFTDYKLLPAEFDPGKGIAVAPDRTQSARACTARINEHIAVQKRELQRIIDELDKQGKPYAAKDITHTYRRIGDNRYVHTFFNTLIGERTKGGKNGTATSYRSTLIAFSKFAGAKSYTFDQITPGMMEQFEEYLLLHGNVRNTVTFYLSKFRTVYNKAKGRGLITNKNVDPFCGVSFKTEKTRKLAVNAATLKLVAEASFGTRSELNETRDLFLFSFYARGMSFADMAYLKTNDIQGGVIRYTRRKTTQIFTVQVTPALQEIIDRYAHCAPWVLPVMKGSSFAWSRIEVPEPDIKDSVGQHRRYKLALSRYEAYLEIISRKLDTDKKLTFNVARHSWATLARSRGIPMPVISEGLGHTSEHTTRIYLDELEAVELHKANRIVTKL